MCARVAGQISGAANNNSTNGNRMTASSCDAPEIRRTKRTKCPGSRRSPSAAGHAARRLSCGRETPRGRYQRRNPDNSRLLKWKAKLVASGDHLLDINGKHYPEQGRLGAPTNLEAIRLVCWWAGMNSTHELLQADVTGTYLQSKLGPTLWPESWRNSMVCYAMVRYGMQLAGLMRDQEGVASQGCLMVY